MGHSSSTSRSLERVFLIIINIIIIIIITIIQTNCIYNTLRKKIWLNKRILFVWKSFFDLKK